MMPKAKPDQVIVHRLELQETEREILSDLATSMMVKNIGEGVGSFVKPFTQATVWGVAWAGSIAAALWLEAELNFIGDDAKPFYPRQDAETAKDYRNRTHATDRIRHGFTDANTTLISWLEKLGLQ